MTNKLGLQNSKFMLEHLTIEIEAAIGEIANDKIGPGLHRLQGLVEFMSPALIAINDRLLECKE